MFGLTALKVLLMIAYGVPGYLLVKTKLLSEKSIKAFAVFLLYVCQPALTVYSLDSVERSPEILINVAAFFGVTLVSQVLIIGLYCLIFRKKLSEAAHRVCAVAGACGNVGFLGIPLLEQLLPDHPEALAYSAAFSVGMNLIAWTLGLTLITGNKKFISVKAMILNPPMISFLAILPFFLTGVHLPEKIADFIEVLGRMSTVVCMTVLGMRLALNSFKKLFTNLRVYIAAFSKLIVFPALTALLFLPVPVDPSVKSAAVILASCPAAAMIHSLSETHGGDSSTAADIVLATSLTCILTIPLVWTVYNALAA
ncbi:MAG: AEC family transporter [Clostridia bacterium]|nr:AEC family transporter [Clostridia bacterium]